MHKVFVVFNDRESLTVHTDATLQEEMGSNWATGRGQMVVPWTPTARGSAAPWVLALLLMEISILKSPNFFPRPQTF